MAGPVGETVEDRVRAERAAQGLAEKITDPELLAPVARAIRAAQPVEVPARKSVAS